jgi:plasmid replication initiation protein
MVNKEVSLREKYSNFIKYVEESQFLTSPFLQRDENTIKTLEKYFPGHFCDLSKLNSNQLYRVMQVKYWEGKLSLER